MKGKLIVIEGCDGAGKTTQARLLTTCEYICFPDRTTEIGKIINDFLCKKISLSEETAQLLFAANKWELVPKITNLLNAGRNVILDRYIYSGIAYGVAAGLSANWCKSIHYGLPEPDLKIFINTDPKNMSNQQHTKWSEIYEFYEFQYKVYEAYHNHCVNPEWLLVSGTIQEIHEKILEHM